MTAKEKAGKRVSRYYDIAVMTWEQAKQCAISECDEVIKWLDEISYGESGTTKIDYGQGELNKMKSEIENM